MNKHLKRNLKPNVNIKPFIHLYHEVCLRDMLDKNELLKYLWCICKLSYSLNFITKNANYANILIKLEFLRHQCILNDNEIG